MKQYHLASILGFALLLVVTIGINQHHQHEMNNRLFQLERKYSGVLKESHSPMIISGGLDALQQQLIGVIDTNRPSVVSIIETKNLTLSRGDPFGQRIIRERKSAKVGGGSGIITTTGGLIITNKHVVADLTSQYTVILHDGMMLDVKNIWLDPILDLAILQVQSPERGSLQLTPATFVSMNDTTQVGQLVVAIGNALAEYDNSATLGMVSATQRQLESDGSSIYIGLLQTDTPINPGNSGGPLIDIRGRIVGMSTAISAGSEGIGFAIPLSKEFVDTMIQSVSENQQLVRPFLGVNYVDLSSHTSRKYGINQTYGALIVEVGANTPADKAGLLSGDIITSIDGIQLDRQYPLLYELYTKQAQATITLGILRNNIAIQIPVKLRSVSGL